MPAFFGEVPVSGAAQVCDKRDMERALQLTQVSQAFSKKKQRLSFAEDGDEEED